MASNLFYYLLLVCILNITIISTSPTQTEILFEAAFQGECRLNGLCQMLCYDLHDGTFECACKEGYTLSDNGYSCIENHLLEEQQLLSNSVKQSDRNQTINKKTKKYFNFKTCEQVHCEAGGICEEVFNLDHRLDQATRRRQMIKRVHQTDVHRKLRCRCPIGRGGFFCEENILVDTPHFDGKSYLALPTLKDARTHMYLEIEFKSETNNGLLLYSGEDQNLKSTFFSIAITQGFVEVKFDCGNGLKVLRSSNLVPLQTWINLKVKKEHNYLSIQLDGQEQVSTMSNGFFDIIEHKLELFLGGSPNFDLIKDRLAIKKGFTGCVRKLNINKRSYDFRADNHGDAIDGIGITQCKDDNCKSVHCLNGGLCSNNNKLNLVNGCLCPSGRFGTRCELEMQEIALRFNGNSMMQLPGIKETALSYLEIKIRFKSDKPNGLLLFNSNSMETKNQDFIQLNLVNGYVYFTFDLGNGPATVRTSTTISIGQWHNLVISRTTRLATISLDNQPMNQTVSHGAYTQLSLFKPLFIGGVIKNWQSDFEQKYLNSSYLPFEQGNENFKGCIQSIEINGKIVQFINSIYNLNVETCVEKPIEVDQEF